MSNELGIATIERLVQDFFSTTGYQVEKKENQFFDYILHKENKKIALKIKRKEKTTAAQLEKFQEQLEQSSNQFASGCVISVLGFTKAALTSVEREQPNNLLLMTLQHDRLASIYPYNQLTENKPTSTRKCYIGMFTAKGGVGKTTSAAHLAGAFAMMGQSVVILDLDPDKNLRKLFLQDTSKDGNSAYIHIPANKGQAPGATITVLEPEQWRESRYPDVNIVICDCSPVLSENPNKLVKRFDVCLMPTTLNPLGVAKHADVILRTFDHIRTINPLAKLFVFINNYDSSKEAQKRNEVLYAYLKSFIDSYKLHDENCTLIDIEQAKIRHSTALFYWGYHIIEGSAPQLAFRETAGKSYPRTDFLQLADYIEQNIIMSAL